MATVVNARDVILQAALPNGRVAGVTMQPNIVVDPSQVTGLGLIINGTKMADIEGSSQVFQVNTAGTATPSSITLTLTLRNIVGTPSISIISGAYTGGLPTLSGGPSVYTASIAYTNMTTDALTIRASVTESSTTYTDDITLVKARDGVNAVNAFLTNESHTVPASDTGIVSSYTGAGGTFKLYQGSTDVSASATYAVQSNPNSLTTSINSTTGVFSVTGGFAGGIDTATVTYRATFGAQTFDKIFTITKSKAGTAGSAGQRGSRTFYVSGITVWSDATATSTASVNGGPIVNDVVTQYGTGFSQTRFWTGSAWTIVAAVVDGSLLVSGTVGAAAIAANAIRTSHLLVTGGGAGTLNSDPGCLDASAWTFSSGSGALVTLALANAASGPGAIELNNGAYVRSQLIAAKPSTGYKLSFYAKRSGSGTSYCRILFFNAAGTNVGYQVADFDGGYGTFEGVAFPTTWTFLRGTATSGSDAVNMMIELYGGYPSGPGSTQYQQVRLEEMIDSSVVISGGLRADRIDTRGLTIRDASNNIIFSASQNLDVARIANNQNILNYITEGNTTYIRTPAGGSAGSTSGSVTGSIRIRLPQGGTDTMLRFSVDIYEYSGGGSVTYDVGGYIYTPSGSGVWVNTSARYDGPPNKRRAINFGRDSSGYMCVFIGGAGDIWAYPQVRVRDVTVGYTNYSIGQWSNGWVVDLAYTTGPTNVTSTISEPTVGGAFGAIDQITSGNASTYIASAAIGSAQIANASITNAHIGNYIASTTFNGTIDGSGNITAPGTAGWAISKGGVAVFDATHIRGQLTVNQIQIPTGAVAAANGDLVNWLGVSGFLGGGGGYSRLATQQTVLSTGVAGLLIGTITVPNSGQTVTALVNGHMYIYFTSNWSGQAANQHELGVSCTLNLRPITGTTTMGTMLKTESIQRAGWHQLYPNTQQLFPYSVSFSATNVPAGTYVAYFTCEAYSMITTTGVSNLYCMNGSGGGGTYIKYNGWVGANAV